MSRKVLGRGLDALLGDEKNAEKEELLEIDLDLIEPNARQPRTNFAEAKLEELAQSIRINGVVADNSQKERLKLRNSSRRKALEGFTTSGSTKNSSRCEKNKR